MIFCLHHSPIRFGNQHITGSQRVLLWYAETPHPVQVQRPWRRWSYHPCKIRLSVWWLTAKSLSFCQCNRHLQWSCGIWLSRPLAKRRWMSVKSGWPTSWSTGVSAGSTTCLRWRDHRSLCSLSLVLSAELHGALGVSSQDYLYGESTKFLSYNDFVNKELVLFSNSDNERSIPCLVDGGSESSAVTKNDSWIWSHALLSVFVCVRQVWSLATGKFCSVASRGMTSGRWRWPSWLVLWQRCQPITMERWADASLEIFFSKRFSKRVLFWCNFQWLCFVFTCFITLDIHWLKMQW